MSKTTAELRKAIKTAAALLTGNGPDKGTSKMRKADLEAYLDEYTERLEKARAANGAYEQEAARNGYRYDEETETWVSVDTNAEYAPKPGKPLHEMSNDELLAWTDSISQEDTAPGVGQQVLVTVPRVRGRVHGRIVEVTSREIGGPVFAVKHSDATRATLHGLADLTLV